MYEDENLSEANTWAKLVTPALDHVTLGPVCILVGTEHD
jgi:hypothetical protein